MTAEPDGLLLDTTVLVDLLRGRDEALAFLRKQTGEVSISVLTVSALHAGARAADALPVARLVSIFRVLPVTVSIAQLGGLLRGQYGDFHGVSLLDALIGATAALHNQALATSNTRHFPMMAEGRLVAPYQ